MDQYRATGLITGIGARKRLREQQEADRNAMIAQQQASQAASEAAGQALIQSSGIDPQQIQPGRMAGLQQLAVTDPDAARMELDEIQAAQGINLSQKDRVDFDIARSNLRKSRLANDLAELNLQRAQGVGMDPATLNSVSNNLRDERRADLAPYTSKLAAYDELISVADIQSGPATVAQLFKFIKSMDDSVVRDSEGRLLTDSTGLVGDFANKFNQMIGKGIFDPNTVASIMQTATALAEQSFNTAQTINQNHDVIAGRYANHYLEPAIVGFSQAASFNPDRTFRDFEGRATETPPPATEQTDELPSGVRIIE
jgi:hypothetical protein